MKPIAIVIGHRASAGGAVNYFGVNEFNWNSELAHWIAQLLAGRGFASIVSVRPDYSGGYSEQCERLNTQNVCCIVSLHFNGGRVNGTETLYYPGSNRGMLLAASLQSAMLDALGLKDRGIKPQKENDRGHELRILTRTKAPAVILEPFFGADLYSATIANERKRLLAECISEGIIRVITAPEFAPVLEETPPADERPGPDGGGAGGGAAFDLGDLAGGEPGGPSEDRLTGRGGDRAGKGARVATGKPPGATRTAQKPAPQAKPRPARGAKPSGPAKRPSKPRRGSGRRRK